MAAAGKPPGHCNRYKISSAKIKKINQLTELFLAMQQQHQQQLNLATTEQSEEPAMRPKKTKYQKGKSKDGTQAGNRGNPSRHYCFSMVPRTRTQAHVAVRTKIILRNTPHSTRIYLKRIFRCTTARELIIGSKSI